MDNCHIREDTKYKPGTYPRNVKIYDPTQDMKTRYHISFEMLSSNLHSDLRDLKELRYCDLKIWIWRGNICARVDSIQSGIN